MNKIISAEEKPWGRYEVLSSFKKQREDGKFEDVVIKKVTINPAKRLSLQSHEGRNEDWFVLSGHGVVLIAEKKLKIKEGSALSVPAKIKHRVTNTDASLPLVFIEIGIGLFDENDIVRYEDDFGRV